MNKENKNESNHFLRYNGFDEKNIYQRRITLMDIVALLEVLVKEIIAAEEKFLKNPKDIAWKPRSRLPQKIFLPVF